jgi:hypothetical protein
MTSQRQPEPEPSEREAFYGWHADNGHAPEREADGGISCTSCGETFPGLPEIELEAG